MEHKSAAVHVVKTLREAGLLKPNDGDLNDKKEELKKILEREPELLKSFLQFIGTIEKPPFDYIAVTQGPGLEPTLWVGINFAKALSPRLGSR